MRIEHIAIQVDDAKAFSKWYGETFGFTVKRKGPPPADPHFIADKSGNVILEVYNHPDAAKPNYPEMHPLTLHLAFVSDDIDADIEKLVAAGASNPEVTTAPNGDVLAMLRDPWGLPIQLCKRVEAMI